MHHSRPLIIKAHSDFDHLFLKQILIKSFHFGLYNRRLASTLAVVKIQTAADAERLADKSEAVHCDQRSTQSMSNLLLEEDDDGYLGAYASPLHKREINIIATVCFSILTKVKTTLSTNSQNGGRPTALAQLDATVGVTSQSIGITSIDTAIELCSRLQREPTSSDCCAKAITPYKIALHCQLHNSVPYNCYFSAIQIV